MNISVSPSKHIASSDLRYDSNTNLHKSTRDNKMSSQKPNMLNKSSLGTSLGGKPKKNNVLENLMKQKENLMESKSNLMQSALDRGDSPSSIKDSIKGIDEQIEEINNQMSKIQLEESRKALGTEDKDKTKTKTKNIAETEDANASKTDTSMDTILKSSSDLSQTKALISQRNSKLNEIRVIGAEIKSDMLRGVDPVAKEKRVAKLKDGIEDIVEKISDLVEHSTKVNTSNNSVDKNKQTKNVSNNESTENADKLSINQQGSTGDINNYIENIDDDFKHNGEKINTLA